VASSPPRIDSLPTQRITKPICKISPPTAAKSGKTNYFNLAVSDSRSAAWQFFTDDYLSMDVLMQRNSTPLTV
jgi:hypothetical protein